MPRPPDPGYLRFNPPISLGSDQYFRAWALLEDMGIKNKVAFIYRGRQDLHGLAFPSKEHAMIFKLRL
jgi:hypothetical protein